MLYEVYIKNRKDKISFPRIQPNPFITGFFELKMGITNPKKVINLTLGDLYALAGFSYAYIYNYKEIKFKPIENYETIYREEERKKYKDLASACLQYAYSLIQKVPRGAKVSFKAV
jgi:hypothetical protein